MTFNLWLKPIDKSYLAEYGGSDGRIGQSGNSDTNTWRNKVVDRTTLGCPFVYYLISWNCIRSIHPCTNTWDELKPFGVANYLICNHWYQARWKIFNTSRVWYAFELREVLSMKHVALTLELVPFPELAQGYFYTTSPRPCSKREPALLCPFSLKLWLYSSIV